jgi:hypothetical protein
MNLTRSEVIDQLAIERKQGDHFIKTWQAGHSFIDIDLIDRFVATTGRGEALEGFELLDMEKMWQTLIDLDPDKLARVKVSGGEIIEWTWVDNHGIEKKTVYPFTPEGIMKIIDDEFFA